ncbi:MAG: hypothetical protein KDB03_05970 [Planctomycetales bacterium]|nr:hypothetical protein [Planctomycetales bacterium]
MSDNGHPTQPTASDPVAQPWVEYWMKAFDQNKQWTDALLAGAPPKVDPTSIRKEWLGAMSKSIEAYLRTPAFLEAMRLNADNLTSNQIASQYVKQEMARQLGVPHLEDIRELQSRLLSATEAVMDRLDSMESRLEAIEKKLDAQAASKRKTEK